MTADQRRWLGFAPNFWAANSIELLERLAYYGLRTVVPIYMVLAVEEGGPQFSHTQKGQIFAAWAAVQTGVPVFTGGLSDRYGYRRSVAVAVAIAIAGYVLMGFALDVAALASGGASVGVPGHPAAFLTFGTGAMLLALGAAVFKPGLQGVLATTIPDERASLGWSIFYQVVNIGAFMGPFLAGYLRLIAWRQVFLACAAIHALNWLLLWFVEEPTRAAPTARPRTALQVVWDSAVGILEPRLFSFLAVFSGFWMMYHQLFDLLPNFIDDWVDSRAIASSVITPAFAAFGATPPAAWNGLVPQEHLININALLCMTLAAGIGAWAQRARSMAVMIAGIVVSTLGIGLLTRGTSGTAVVTAIAVFTIGELLASPTKNRYFGEIAPPDKKGLYMGYINATNAIGWAIGSSIAGAMYEADGDKVVLARRYLVDRLGVDAAAVAALPKTEVLPKLMSATQLDEWGIRQLLWDQYAPWQIWITFAYIGLSSLIGLIAYDQISRRNLPHEALWLVGLTVATCAYAYGPVWSIGFGALMLAHHFTLGSRGPRR